MSNQAAIRHPAPIPGFITGNGQNDTHAATLSDGRQNPHRSAGTPYDIITGQEIAEMVEDPPSVPKDRAQWFIPSTYAANDGRSHNAQREHGVFWWLVLDVDHGNLSLEQVAEALIAVLGRCSMLIYATRSATPENRKWRALARLQDPVAGADYADTAAAFYDLLEEHPQGDLICDRKMQGPGQLVYLPNRGAYYDHRIETTKRLILSEDHPVIQRRDRNRADRAKAEAEVRAARDRKAALRLDSGLSDAASVVDHFNETNRITDLLEHYGYTRAGHGNDWRSPMQQTRSHATHDCGDHWISLSCSDDAVDIGAATKSGHRFGDAFDLFVYFDHGGDFAEAVRSHAQEAGIDHESPRGQSSLQGRTAQEKTGKTIAGGIRAVPDWPEPAHDLLGNILPSPPALPLADVLGPVAAEWVSATAEASGAPADYVLYGLLSGVGGIIGNALWVSPWKGWAEPPVIWSMCVGLPSAGKSPALDAVLSGIRGAEKLLRTQAVAQHDDWEKRQKLAKIAEQTWEAKCRKAMEKGDKPPEMPSEADAGEEPHIPRLIINDTTVERIGVIVAAQPKGVLQVRDELSGWLLAMEARNGGSDRAFWIESYGGRSFTVERMGRPPLTIDHLTIGLLGGIQPDKLSELLVKAADDGLMARLMPTWPAPAPVKRPERFADSTVANEAWGKLGALQMPVNGDGEHHPCFVTFDDAAAKLMDEWRAQCQGWEADAEGLQLSHIGKLNGLAARLSLVLAAIDHSFDGAARPEVITPNELGRACHFIESYALPMARRCYASASVPNAERAARRLLKIIQDEGWHSFTTRQVMRRDRVALGSKFKLDPALNILLEGDCIRAISAPQDGPLGGRPVKAFEVNPAVFRRKS